MSKSNSESEKNLQAEQNAFVFDPGSPIELKRLQTDSGAGFDSEEAAKESLERDTKQFVSYQERLMAHETYGLLVLFQGMDASGKDEAITHVLTHLDPRGCEFKQFKTFTAKEEKHDYLWRAVAALPARGQVGIFNRSYYEHVVAERLHPEALESQNLPPEARENIWDKRFRHINHFESYLADNGIHLLKFFLHVSKEEQRKRLLERIDDPEQQWQFSSNDVKERALWKEYEEVYSKALTATNTAEAPWHIIPADRPWSARAAVARIFLEKLKSFHTGYPKWSKEQRQQMEEARAQLEADKE
jgi:PPK2 family polyphosphate:nucleotide phosphotransferase